MFLLITFEQNVLEKWQTPFWKWQMKPNFSFLLFFSLYLSIIQLFMSTKLLMSPYLRLPTYFNLPTPCEPISYLPMSSYLCLLTYVYISASTYLSLPTNNYLPTYQPITTYLCLENHYLCLSYLDPVWPEKNHQMSIKVA